MSEKVSSEGSEPDRLYIIRRPAVERVTGLSKATLYNLVRKGLFPPPMKLGPRVVGWRERDVIDWLADLMPSIRAPHYRGHRQK